MRLKPIETLLSETTVGEEKEWFVCDKAGELVNSIAINGRERPLVEEAIKAIQHKFRKHTERVKQQSIAGVGSRFGGLPATLTPYLFQTEIDGSMAEGASHPHKIEDVGKGYIQEELLIAQDLLREEIRRVSCNSNITLVEMSVPAYAYHQDVPIRVPLDVSDEFKAYYRRLIMDPAYGRNLRFTGKHITVKIANSDFEQAIHYTRIARPYVPLFIALGANSPYGEGEFREYHSWRYKAFPQPSKVDVPWLYQSAQYYKWITQDLLDQKIIYRLPNQIFTPVRPKMYGGVELRVLDTGHEYEYERAITLLFGLLMVYLAHHLGRHDYRYNPVAHRQLRQNEAKSAQYGLEAEVILPLDGLWKKIKIRNLGALVMDRIEPLTYALEQSRFLEPIKAVLSGDPTPAVATKLRYKAYQQTPNTYRTFISDEIRRKDHLLTLNVAPALKRVVNRPKLPQEADLQQLGYIYRPEFLD